MRRQYGIPFHTDALQIEKQKSSMGAKKMELRTFQGAGPLSRNENMMLRKRFFKLLLETQLPIYLPFAIGHSWYDIVR